MKIPSTIDECNLRLSKIVSEEDKLKISQMGEDEFILSSHFGLGMYIRNKWLYQPDSSELKKNLSKNTYYHEDDISCEILKLFYQSLKIKNDKG